MRETRLFLTTSLHLLAYPSIVNALPRSRGWTILLQDQRDRLVSRTEPGARQGSVHRGNVRLFFGGSGGRSGARAMLETALAARESGVDVVVAWVNPAGSEVIDHLLRGFECMTPASGAGGEHRPARIDVDAVRKRTPQILLVDPQTSPPSFGGGGTASVRSNDWWADIEHILASGIDVWAVLDATGFSSWTSVGAGIPSRLNSLSLL
jgi:two-component system, OmpR family, sensor histidine kinase KdpD